MADDSETTKNRITTLSTKISDVEDELTALTNRVTSTENRLTSVENTSSNNTSRISTLEKDNTTNKSDIVNIKSKDSEQDEQISTITSSLSSLTNKVDENISRIDETATTNSTTAKNYSDKLYDQIMEYIDYYHHIHTNPPNFDEPYAGDPITGSYVYPVGTVYETIDADFDPATQYPGSWKFIGITYIKDSDANVVAEKYMYVRIQ
jgi:hypothetical protein